MRFKDARVKAEYAELPTRNSRLFAVIAFVDAYSQLKFGREALITCILRTKAEQTAICQEMGVAYYMSVHELWRGVDFRSYVWSDNERAELNRAVNETFFYSPSYKTLAFHVKGTAVHLHGQVPHGTHWRMG